ncbi:MAG: ABC-type transport auxiliary lipoprotein family protein [Rhodocyclales bacterium]|nr:ABC-type transport auxiliary lipoprotein family protein [Rhodocyclales bacterium]
MSKWPIAILAGLLLAACGSNVRTTEAARYDFGNLPAKVTEAGPVSRVPIAAVDVQAASWLSGPAMHFRLAYAEPLRRQSFTESRWAAPPAELLEAFLKRRIVFGQADFNGSGCRLQVTLEELEQRFDEPQKSQTILEVRALLTPMRGAEILSRKAFLIHKPAPTADARGGVAAARDAVQVLAADIGGWFDEVVREKPAIVERCRT